MIRIVLLIAAVVVGLSAAPTQADHRSRGPRVGIGIGGGGFQLYIGPRGYFGPGFYNGYGYGGYGGYYGYGPGYYYSPRYYYSAPYVAPGYVYSESAVVTPDPQFDGGMIVLMNPAANSESVEYTLNGQRFVMRPGQSQRFNHDRPWVIEFDRGDGRSFARYSLKSATYKFKPTDRGWELFEQADSRPPVGAPPPPPMDDPPPKPAEPPAATDPARPLPDPPKPKAPDAAAPENSRETIIRPRSATKVDNSETPGPKLPAE